MTNLPLPNVPFPCAALYDQGTGWVAIYYGGADTVTALAFAKMEELIILGSRSPLAINLLS